MLAKGLFPNIFNHSNKSPDLKTKHVLIRVKLETAKTNLWYWREEEGLCLEDIGRERAREKLLR